MTTPEPCDCTDGPCRRDMLLGEINLQLHREEFAKLEATRLAARLKIGVLRRERMALEARCVCLERRPSSVRRP